MNRNFSSQAAIPAVNTDDGAGRTDLLERSDMQNAKFEEYYRRQAIISAGEVQGESQNEWSAFMETLREPLPTTFRIAGTRQCVIQSFLAFALPIPSMSFVENRGYIE